MKEVSMVAMERTAFLANSLSTNMTKGKSDFDSYMNFQSQSDTNQIKTETGSQPYDAVKTQTVHKIDGKETVADMDSADVSDAVTNTDSVIEDAETMQVVNDAINSVVKDALGIDDETLVEAMTALGMTPVDLLNVNNLQELVLFINGSSDVTDLLTNESMMMDLSNLTEAIADIDWESLTGISKEDFVQTLESMLNQGVSATDGETVLTEADTGMAADSQTAQTDEVPVIVEYEDEQAYTAKQNVTEQTKIVSDDTADVGNKVSKQNDGNTNTDTAKLQDTKNGDANAQQNTDGQSESLKQDMTESVRSDAGENAHATVVNGTADFLQNLNQAVNDVSKPVFSQQTNMQQMIDIVNQVVEQIKVTMGKETTSMQLQLNPESLGKVLISVTSNHGVMTANFTVQSEEAKEALQSQMYSLKEALEGRNLKVEAVEVEVSDFAFSQSSQSEGQDKKSFENGSGKRMRFEFDDADEAELVSDEAGSRQAKPARLESGSSIDFTA